MSFDLNVPFPISDSIVGRTAALYSSAKPYCFLYGLGSVTQSEQREYVGFWFTKLDLGMALVTCCDESDYLLLDGTESRHCTLREIQDWLHREGKPLQQTFIL